MAIRLGDYVVYGELYNTSHYSTHGIIALRGETPGEDIVLRLDLTGNCDADLQGKGFRFMPPENGADDKVFRFEDFQGFQDRQIGPTGVMTAQGWVRALPCSAAEYVLRAELGEEPPTEWKRHLYLEWFGQNGRVLIELADATVEECLRIPKGDDEGEWAPLPNLAPLPDNDARKKAAGPSFTVIRAEGAHVDIERWTPVAEEDSEEHDKLDAGPGDLQRQLDSESAKIDREIREADGDCDGDPDDSSLAEWELMDYCIEHCDGEPMASLLDDTDQWPDPDELDDTEIEAKLKSILAELARSCVTLDVCKHFTPRDCYRLLKDTILHESRVYRELAGTGWVQHNSTHEYCPKCDAEFEEEYTKFRDEQGDVGPLSTEF